MEGLVDRSPRGLGLLFGRAFVLTAASVLVGIVWNAVRPHGIPLVAPRPYEIFAPCPETETEARQVTADQLAAAPGVLYVDARPEAEYRAEHIEGAVSVPYPLLTGELDPPALDALKRRRVPIVTYGDGEHRGDLGELLASLLLQSGVEDVTNLQGGLRSWKQGGGAVAGDGLPRLPDAAAPDAGDGGAR